MPLEKVIERKMIEELGEGVKYTVSKPIVFMRHRRNEVNQAGQEVNIFAVGFEANLDSGEIKMSDMHTEMEWVDIKTFKPENYFTGGWLKGLQDYLALKN